MTIIYANQGQVEEAIDLYKQSLELNDRIGNMQGKAATLHQMAIIYANQGQVEEAIDLYNSILQFFAICRKILSWYTIARIGNVSQCSITVYQNLC
jgi:tetratricopeptide (TPR) repeat protein